MSLTWGMLFGGIALMSMLAARAMRLPLPWPEEQTSLVVVATRWAFIGMMGGALFSLGVIVTGRRRTLDQISARRFGMLGFGIGAALPVLGAAFFAGLSTLAVPAMWVSAIPVALLCGGVSGLVAAASLGAARSSGPMLENDTPNTFPPAI